MVDPRTLATSASADHPEQEVTVQNYGHNQHTLSPGYNQHGNRHTLDTGPRQHSLDVSHYPQGPVQSRTTSLDIPTSQPPPCRITFSSFDDRYQAHSVERLDHTGSARCRRPSFSGPRLSLADPFVQDKQCGWPSHRLASRDKSVSFEESPQFSTRESYKRR